MLKMPKELAVTIRKAIPEDALAIKDIQVSCLNRVFNSYYTEIVLKKWTSLLTPQVYIPKIKSEYWFLVATLSQEEGGSVVGYGFLNTNARKPELVPAKYDCKYQLESLYVEVEYQRHGFGTKLMEEFEKIAVRNGCKRLGILASLPGVPFYSKLGYCSVETSVPFDITQQTFTPGDYSIVTEVMYKDL